MSDHSTIEWTDATWNPVTGCSVLSPGCTNCYAMKLAGTRLRNHPSRKGLTKDSKAGPVWTGEVRFNEGWLTQPLQWKKPRMVFVCAHGDLFHEDVPDAWIDRVFAVMALSSQHTFQVLTKRATRMREYLTSIELNNRVGSEMAAISDAADCGGIRHDHPGWAFERPPTRPMAPLPNVWLGISAERQREADARIPELLATPAAVRFLSIEPLLGPIDLDGVKFTLMPGYFGSALRWHHRPHADRSISYPKVDWVIVGGESGDQARPMSIQWARELRDQCAAAEVPFFFKQWGEWRPAGCHASGTPGRFAFGDYEHDRSAMIQVDAYPRQFTTFGARTVMQRVGKKAAGRLLDGVEHNAMPARAGQ